MNNVQLSLLPSLGWKMSTGQSAVMLCSWGVKEGRLYLYSTFKYAHILTKLSGMDHTVLPANNTMSVKAGMAHSTCG